MDDADLPWLVAAIVLWTLLCPSSATAADAFGVGAAGAPPMSVDVHWAIEIAASYDNNLFASPSNRESDHLALISPSLELNAGSARQNLLIEAAADFGRYRAHPDEDFSDYRLALRSRQELTPWLSLFGSLGTMQDHEGRDSPDADRSGDEPTTYLAHNADLGIVFAAGPYQWRFGGTVEALRFDNVPSGDGTLINEDRDRNHYGLGLRLARRTSPQTQVFIQGQYDRRDYLASTDIFGFRRDSRGHRVSLGMRHLAGGGLSVEGYLGYLGQRYVDPAFDDIAALDIGLSLELPVSPTTRWSAELRRELLETTEFGASGYLLTDLGVTFGRRITDRLQFNADAYYGIGSFEQTAREDELLGLGASLDYALSGSWLVTLGYQWTRRDAQLPQTDSASLDEIEDYERHLISFGLRASFGREYE